MKVEDAKEEEAKKDEEAAEDGEKDAKNKHVSSIFRFSTKERREYLSTR